MSEPRWLNETQKEAWWGLRVILSRAWPEIERQLNTYGLLAVHYHMFVTLSDAPNRTLRLSELADLSNMSQSRLTHRMRELVDSGDVVISKDPNDGRAKNATLTAAGQARLEAMAPAHAENVQSLIFDHLNEEQTANLAEALSLIANSLVEHPEFLNPNC